MRLKRIYTRLLVESVKNSGMWLKEAKILAQKGSKGHARALLIFAGEELGKAFYCWMAINGVYPYNHPEVDYRSRKHNSIFRSHALKNASAFGVMMGVLAPDSVPDEFDAKIDDPQSGERIELREFLGRMGALAAWARSTWMYVDIITDADGRVRVASPLEIPVGDLEEGLSSMETTIKMFKKIVRGTPYAEEMLSFFAELRNFLQENDPSFPDHPIWDWCQQHPPRL